MTKKYWSCKIKNRLFSSGDFPTSFITIGTETDKSISSLYSYYQYKAEKTQIQQCQKIMDSALDEIDFLQDFEAKLSGTWQDLYYEND